MAENNNVIANLSDLGLCEITPCDTAIVNENKSLAMTPSQKSQISALVSHMPELASTAVMANAYTISFPKGVNGALMEYKAGGKGTPIVGENGKIVGHASLNEVSDSATIMMSAFSVMSILSSQYYLKEINDQFGLLNQKIDAIVNFLYGDKKAELMAEICFVQNAYKNYSSIMSYNEQRIATISSLQSAQKVAMKDIEFYLNDLSDKADLTAKNYNEFEHQLNDAFKIKDSLEMSIQLYSMTNIMEMHYSQNYDNDYVENVKDNLVYYIKKCERQILSSFSKLYTKNQAFKPGKITKANTALNGEKIEKIVAALNAGDDSELNAAVTSAFDSLFDSCTFQVTDKGNVYKIA